MRRSILLWTCVLACSSSSGPPPKLPQHRAAAGDLAIVGATIVPMDRPGSLAGHTVLVRGTGIVAIAPAAEIDTTGATIIDARGKWLMPGLADMHVHAWQEASFGLFLLNGVTTVRNLFGSPESLKFRDAIARGELAGPTFVTAGPIVDGDPPTWPTSATPATPEAAREEVRKQKQAGFDAIKVYNSLSADVYDAIVDEAKRQRIPVVGHVPKAVGIAKVIAAGQRTVEHLDGYVPFVGENVVTPEIVAATVKAGMWNCPTLVVTERLARFDQPESFAKTRGLEYVPQATLATWDPKRDFRFSKWTPEMYVKFRAKNEARKKLVGDLLRAKAKIVVGTDAGNPYVIHGFAVQDEIALLVGAGLSPWQALHAATAAAAEVLGTPGAFGVVSPGSRADLIVLDRDPLVAADVSDPAHVIVRGKHHARAALLAAAKPKPAVAAGDRFATLPALEVEGERLVEAHYDVRFAGAPIGGERAVLSRVGGIKVIHGQGVYEGPQPATFQYRSTADTLEIWEKSRTDATTVARKGGKIVATPAGGELAAGKATLIAPQTIAAYFWYLDPLAKLAIGAKHTLDTVEVVLEGGARLDAGKFTLVRAPDADGRRVYTLTGTHGKLDLTGQLVFDKDGAPYRVELTLKWGTFELQRTR
ncbi:MAG TPA: amidohydrolase family protein [Kofleriaceae bacterium]